jgi:hypothetical protein
MLENVVDVDRGLDPLLLVANHLLHPDAAGIIKVGGLH